MKLRYFVAISIFLFSLLLVVRVIRQKQQTQTTAASSGPLHVLPANPRYFTDGSGRAIYLTGAHTWNTIQDMSSTEPLPGGSFDGYLHWLKGFNHNFARLWMVEHAWDADDNSTYSPLPWPRTGDGTALDGKPKFDVSKFDESYFDRIRTRALAAQNQGIYVSIMLFDDWSTENAGAWKGHPFNAANNINNINADANGDGLGIEFHTLDNPEIKALQEAYVQKMADTVNDFDNVIYEIANETGVSRDWQYHFIDYVKRYEATKPKQHPVGTTIGYPVDEMDNAALLGSNSDFIAPGDYDNPPQADGSKVIFPDTDHNCPSCFDRADWIWKSFLRGLNPIYMDDLKSGEGREETRQAMGQTLTYANKMNLASMIPQGNVSSTGYALANPGAEYLMYQPGSGAFTVMLDAGNYAGEWFNPTAGQTSSGGTVNGGSTQTFTPPFSGVAVLYLKNTSITGTPTTTATLTPTPIEPTFACIGSCPTNTPQPSPAGSLSPMPTYALSVTPSPTTPPASGEPTSGENPQPTTTPQPPGRGEGGLQELLQQLLELLKRLLELLQGIGK